MNDNNESGAVFAATYDNDANGVNYDTERIFIVRRRDMAFLSDYFRRDARRYDNGFETY